MIVVGIRFKPAGKVYYFDPNGVDLNIQDGVIVETARGWNSVRLLLNREGLKMRK